jgi:hypothetical protein
MRPRSRPLRLALWICVTALIGLFGLTNMGLYPRSMVGVPGEEISNMAPPTLAIVALASLQVGVLMLNRERILRWTGSGLGERVVDFASRHAMPVFLWHAPGFAVAYGLWRLAGLPGQRVQASEIGTDPSIHDVLGDHPASSASLSSQALIGVDAQNAADPRRLGTRQAITPAKRWLCREFDEFDYHVYDTHRLSDTSRANAPLGSDVRRGGRDYSGPDQIGRARAVASRKG